MRECCAQLVCESTLEPAGLLEFVSPVTVSFGQGSTLSNVDEWGVHVRRLIAASIALAALAFSASTASAVSGGAAVENKASAFTMSSSLTETNGVPTGPGCEFLPDDVAISWEGTLHSVTVQKVEPSGAFTEQNTSTASGKATDEDGNEYAFSYSNHYKITETAAGSGVLTGTMTDHFSLAGNHINLNNGFTATFTVSGAGITLDPSRAYGSPLDFTSGAALCDPL
jgi:hypothetical protein